MDKSKKRHLAYEALMLLGVIILLCFITRLWPILLLVLVGAIVAGILLVFASLRKPEVINMPPMMPLSPVPETERGLVRLAFTILERRITEAVLCDHPGARWVWETQNPENALHAGEPLHILLNNAGGFRKAQVIIINLRYVGLSYLTTHAITENAQNDPAQSSDSEDEQETASVPMPANYELMALDWVEDHIGFLSDQCNEAIARGDNQFLLPASVLPMRESWPAVCDELMKHDFTNTLILNDGISIATPQYQE